MRNIQVIVNGKKITKEDASQYEITNEQVLQTVKQAIDRHNAATERTA